MIGRLVLAELRNRPGRALFLLAGYAFGVAVMVVLLSVGEAMLVQAREEALLGGGDLIVTPAGVSPELLRAGGATALFLRIEQARFLQRQVFESPRGREDYGIVAASPLLDGRTVEISRAGRTAQAIASAEIPSRATTAGAAPRLLAGSWTDSDRDRRWVSPSADELLHEIDHFHYPRGSALGDSTWAEWHYFNLRLDPERWLYLTYMVAGEVGVPGRWGGRLLLTVRDPERGHVNYSRDIDAREVVIDTARADLRLDDAAYVRVANGEYHVVARVGGADMDLRIRPAPNRFFPTASLGGPDVVSGYVVPAIAATATGRVCLPPSGRCEEVDGAAAYHDHNWGVWSDVAWDWGAASDDEVSLLYGGIRGPGIPDQGIFVYSVDARGVRGLYRPPAIEREGSRDIGIGTLRVPTTLRFEDPRRGTQVTIELDDYQVTDMERPIDRYFLQMSGVATLRESGAEPRTLPGFFEIFVD